MRGHDQIFQDRPSPSKHSLIGQTTANFSSRSQSAIASSPTSLLVFCSFTVALQVVRSTLCTYPKKPPLRILRTHDRLLCALLDFAVIYVATTPKNFEDARRFFERRFPAITMLQLAGYPSRSTDAAPEQPRASFATERITHPYPSALNPDPGYDAGQDKRLRDAQKFLFSSELRNDTG